MRELVTGLLLFFGLQVVAEFTFASAPLRVSFRPGVVSAVFTHRQDSPLMALPNVLLVGAMKGGTTTLFFDLVSHPGAFVPLDKELAVLATDEVLSEAGRERWEGFYKRSLPGQVIVDGSTDYTKLPVVRGVAKRARYVLGENVRIVYVVREPVARAVSHHRHIADAGDTTQDFETAIRTNPDLIDFGRYAMQIEPWISEFGRDRVMIIRMESYMHNRVAGSSALFSFVGLDPEVVRGGSAPARNVGDGKAIHNRLSRFIASSRLYRSMARPLLSGSVRTRLKGLVMSRSVRSAAVPSAASVDLVLAETANDCSAIESQFDFGAGDHHLWDPGAVRARFESLRRSTSS